MFQLHLPFQKAKVNCCSSLMASCHKLRALLIKRKALLIFFFLSTFSDGCQSPVWGGEMAENSEGYTARTQVNIRQYLLCLYLTSCGLYLI